MTRLRKILLVTASALALGGLQACASETELNPQPLPPGGEPTRSPDDKGGADNGAGSSGAMVPGSSDAAASDGGASGDGGTAEAGDQ